MEQLPSGMRALLLAAGSGKRLRPLTDHWPKPLMPVNGRPLLEIWLEQMSGVGIREVIVNVHHHSEEMLRFLDRPAYRDWVSPALEPEILGTAGSIRANWDRLGGQNLVLVHADNLCQCDFRAFLDFHRLSRPEHTDMTMMTFETEAPEACGIVETDEEGVVVGFHEKVTDPPGCRANGAVYVLDEVVVDWIGHNSEIIDFSTEVIPQFLGRIATWMNNGVHRDIGTPEMLMRAQCDPVLPRETKYQLNDEWSEWFMDHPIHTMVTTGPGRS